MEYEHLCNLEVAPRNNWRIKIRVARKWNEMNADNGEVAGIHMVFIDECHKRIHAWIDTPLVQQMDSTFVVKRSYFVRNFVVAPYNDKDKCFEGDKHIILTNMTCVRELDVSFNVIPENIFKFTNLRHFDGPEEQDNHLVDIVGILDDVRPLELMTDRTNQPLCLMKFTVTDLIHNVNVCFWDSLAKDFAAKYYDAVEHPAIIIISSCKMMRNNYNGTKFIKNVEATTFDLNANCERVYNLRKRFWEVHGM